MKPVTIMRSVALPPQGVLALVVWVLVTAVPTRALAQPKEAPPPASPSGAKKTKVFDFTGLDISGRLRTPQLLYFLERANEELERASLERRSFIPAMLKTVDEERL